jgi:hypothetical protein
LPDPGPNRDIVGDEQHQVMVEMAAGKDNPGLRPDAVQLAAALHQRRPHGGVGFNAFGLASRDGDHGPCPWSAGLLIMD